MRRLLAWLEQWGEMQSARACEREAARWPARSEAGDGAALSTLGELDMLEGERA